MANNDSLEYHDEHINLFSILHLVPRQDSARDIHQVHIWKPLVKLCNHLLSCLLALFLHQSDNNPLVLLPTNRLYYSIVVSKPIQ